MCSLCRLPVAKNHNFEQILTFWGFLYRPPFTDEGQIWCAKADPRYTLLCAKFRLDRLVCRPLAAKTPKFCLFWTSAFCGVATLQQSEKVEHGCTTRTNLPLSNGIKIVSVFQRFHGEIGHTIYDVQERDGQTDSRSRSLYAIARPSVVCLSSVTFVRPTQAVQIFRNISMALGTLAIH